MITGVFEHYKGGIYRVLGIAGHTETKEKLVVYKDMQGEMYARPYDMFFGDVFVNGETVPRFRYIGNITE
jgi:hypothetical protein